MNRRDFLKFLGATAAVALLEVIPEQSLPEEIEFDATPLSEPCLMRDLYAIGYAKALAIATITVSRPDGALILKYNINAAGGRLFLHSDLMHAIYFRPGERPLLSCDHSQVDAFAILSGLEDEPLRIIGCSDGAHYSANIAKAA